MGEFGIGQPVPRTEDPRLLDGRGQFGDDFKLANQCHGYILRSPHANAKIVSINANSAKASPGVLLVLTGEDWLKEKFSAFPILVRVKKKMVPPCIQDRGRA